jgi:hypothetical protein
MGRLGERDQDCGEVNEGWYGTSGRVERLGERNVWASGTHTVINAIVVERNVWASVIRIVEVNQGW